MARPLSIDLRERVVDAVERGGLSRRQAAERFGVGVSTVIAWVARFRRTGSVAPGRMGGHRPKKLVGRLARLAHRALPGAGLHAARAGGGARRARAAGRLPHGVGVRPRRGAHA